MMVYMDSVEHFYAKDRASWRRWLERNHENKSAVWLVFDKGPQRTMSWGDIVDEALCYGWIDSKPGKVSDTQSKLYVSKRKPKSVWSKINKAKVEELIQNNRMHASGLRAIATAKENGSWDALNNSDNLIVPEEMMQLFELHPIAKKNFASFTDSQRRTILEWIYGAKQDTTRKLRIEKAVARAEQNLKAH